MLRLNFKKRAVNLLIILLLSVMLLPFSMGEAFGYDESMKTTNFDVSVVLYEDHTMDVKETIIVDFLSPHHGIFRNIVYKGKTEEEYKGQVYDAVYNNKIRDVKVNGYDLNTYSEGEFYVMQIGSANYYLEGPVTYEIDYRVEVREQKNKDFDHFYYNLIPDGWSTPIESAHITITFPKPVKREEVEILYGNYSDTRISDYELSQDGRALSVSFTDLEYQWAVTVRGAFDEGYFTGAKDFDWALKALLLGLILSPVLAFLLWFRYGRDPFLVKTVEFYSPPGISSAEAGYIIDGNIDRQDMVSLVVYLADQGYLTIKGDEEGKNIILHKVKDLPQNAKVYLQTFFKGLFTGENGTAVAEMNMKDLKGSFYSHYTGARSQLDALYTLREENRLFEPSSKGARRFSKVLLLVPSVFSLAFGSVYLTGSGELAALGLPSIILILLGARGFIKNFDRKEARKKHSLFAGNIFSLLLLTIGLLIPIGALLSIGLPAYLVAAIPFSTVIILILSVIMKKRTAKGNELLGKVLGFRDFIKKAELDRIKVLLEEDPQYFYHVLPFAYAFGLTNQWIKKFEEISIEPPSFADPSIVNQSFLPAYWLSNMMSGVNNTFANVAIPSSELRGGSSSHGGGRSGGGGFSGGSGFSGGGMDGGGGGGW